MTLVTPEAIARFRAGEAPLVPVTTPFPRMVLVDVTTRCNLACAHCPSSTLSSVPGYTGDLDTAIYMKIVDELAGYPDTIFRPFDGGEPLLRRDLPDLVAAATSRGIRNVAITTNGTLLTPRVRAALIEAGLTGLEVSIDAATAGTYAVVRRSPLFDRVVAQTLAFIDEGRAAGRATRVTVSFVLQRANAHEREAFRAFWQNEADAVYIREAHQHHALVSGSIRVAPEPPAAALQRHPCPFLFERLIVHHDGSVKFCEFDWLGDHSVGDVRTETLAAIWNGPAMRALRASHVAGRFDHPFCAGCTDWKEVRWPGLW